MKQKKLRVSLLTFGMMLVFVFAMNITAFAASAAPSGLRQTGASEESITIAWNAVLGCYGYNIYYSDDNVNFIRLDPEDKYDTTSTQQYIGNLSAGNTYYVKVCAVNQVGSYPNEQYIEGATCASIDVVTAPDNSNTKVIQTGATTSSYTLKVTGVVGANYYYAYDDKDVVLAKSTKNTLKVTKRPSGKQERLYVRASRKSSSGFIAETTFGYELEYFGTLTKKLSKNHFGITNAWTNIDSYWFEINSDYDFDGWQLQLSLPNGKKVKTYTKESKSYIDVDKYINGAYYRYRVRTYLNINGKKVFSNWSDYQTIAVPKKVSAKFTRSGKKFTLNWSAVKGASSYAIYVSDKENSGYKKVGTVKKRSITINKYGKKSIKKSKKYYVRIVPMAKIGKKNVPAQSYKYVEVYRY